MKIRSRSGIVVAAVLASAIAAAAGRPITLALKLPAKPPAAVPTLPVALTTIPVRLDLVDARQADDTAIVGAQREKGADTYLWRAKQPVAPAVAEFVRQILGGWSVRTAPDGEIGLSMKLERYWVAETSQMFGSSYAADVRLTVSLIDRTGEAIWTYEGIGTAKDSGADGRASTCNELLSVALRDALAQALSSSTAPTASPGIAPATAAAPLVVEPEQLLQDLVRLKGGGVADDVLVGFVKQRKLTRPLSADEILAWKNAGIPDGAIKAAVAE